MGKCKGSKSGTVAVIALIVATIFGGVYGYLFTQEATTAKQVLTSIGFSTSITVAVFSLILAKFSKMRKSLNEFNKKGDVNDVCSNCSNYNPVRVSN